jgi:hypothetical protein
MSDPVVDKIQKNPKYLELRKKRSGFGWFLTLLMMVVYYGYIALIAFNKPSWPSPSAHRRHHAGHSHRHGRDHLHDRDHRHLRAARQQRIRRTDHRNPERRLQMKKMTLTLAALLALLTTGLVYAAGGDVGQAAKQETNWTAIIMFTVRGRHAVHHQMGGRARPSRPLTSTPAAAASPASRTAWRLRATTCPRPRSWVSPRP